MNKPEQVKIEVTTRTVFRCASHVRVTDVWSPRRAIGVRSKNKYSEMKEIGWGGGDRTHHPDALPELKPVHEKRSLCARNIEMVGAENFKVTQSVT